MGTTLDGFNPFFVAAYNALNAHCGGGASVGSGARTIEEQRALLYKRSQGILVADPGTSRHEGNHGGAIDLEFANESVKACMHENANAFGLGFDVPGEDWHIQFSDEGEAAAMDGTFAEKFGIGADAEDPAAPEAEETLGDRWNRMVFGRQPEDVHEVIEGKTKERAVGEEPLAKGTLGDAAPQPGFVSENSAGMAPTDEAMDPVEVARLLANAGFKGDALVTALAIAFGESGLDPDIPGDTTITGGGWGPSLGLMQIRSNVEGGWRDASQLTDPVFNTKAAYSISNGATDFTPWTVYKTGDYKQYLDQARAAVAQLGGDATFVPDSSRILPKTRDFTGDEILEDPIPDVSAGLVQEMSGEGLLDRIGIKRKKTKVDTGVPREEVA